MKYGFVLPGGDARTAANLAQMAEEAGWDGFFVWDPVRGVDPWVALTAAAMLTERIRLGTMLTPVSRYRPWTLAGQTATLDNLSGGRVILAVGLGATDTGFEEFGEVTDRKTRAELMDEGLEIITGLWRGQPFTYNGKHYHIKETAFHPPAPPVQQPGIPIWVVGAWPRMKSMHRTLRYSGLLPNKLNDAGEHEDATPDDIRAIKSFIRENRTESGEFDVIVEGETPGDDREKAAATVREWADAGATWWLETMWSAPWDKNDMSKVIARIRQGPPRSE